MVSAAMGSPVREQRCLCVTAEAADLGDTRQEHFGFVERQTIDGPLNSGCFRRGTLCGDSVFAD
jgi:hypothetical protein